MATWTLYILECADGSLYTGVTTDIHRRVRAHQRGTASRYTRSRLPVRLVYREEHPSRGEALRREARIKKMDRQTKLALAGGEAR